MVAKVNNFQKEINEELQDVQLRLDSIREKIQMNCGEGGFLKGVPGDYLHNFDTQIQLMNDRLDYDKLLWAAAAANELQGAKPAEKNSGFFGKIKSGVAKLLNKEKNTAVKK